MCFVKTKYCPDKMCDAVQHKMKPCVNFCTKHYDSLRAAYDHHAPGPDGPVVYLQMRNGDPLPSCRKLISTAQEVPCVDHASAFRKLAAKKKWGEKWGILEVIPPSRAQTRRGLQLVTVKVKRNPICNKCAEIEEFNEDYLVFSEDGMKQFFQKYQADYEAGGEIDLYQYIHYMPACAEFPHNLGGLNGAQRAKNILSWVEDYAWMGAGRDEIITWKRSKFNEREIKEEKKFWQRKSRTRPATGKYVKRNVLLGSRRGRNKPSKTTKAQRRMTME